MSLWFAILSPFIHFKYHLHSSTFVLSTAASTRETSTGAAVSSTASRAWNETAIAKATAAIRPVDKLSIEHSSIRTKNQEVTKQYMESVKTTTSKLEALRASSVNSVHHIAFSNEAPHASNKPPSVSSQEVATQPSTSSEVLADNDRFSITAKKDSTQIDEFLKSSKFSPTKSSTVEPTLSEDFVKLSASPAAFLMTSIRIDKSFSPPLKDKVRSKGLILTTTVESAARRLLTPNIDNGQDQKTFADSTEKLAQSVLRLSSPSRNLAPIDLTKKSGILKTTSLSLSNDITVSNATHKDSSKTSDKLNTVLLSSQVASSKPQLTPKAPAFYSTVSQSVPKENFTSVKASNTMNVLSENILTTKISKDFIPSKTVLASRKNETSSTKSDGHSSNEIVSYIKSVTKTKERTNIPSKMNQHSTSSPVDSSRSIQISSSKPTELHATSAVSSFSKSANAMESSLKLSAQRNEQAATLSSSIALHSTASALESNKVIHGSSMIAVPAVTIISYSSKIGWEHTSESSAANFISRETETKEITSTLLSTISVSSMSMQTSKLKPTSASKPVAGSVNTHESLNDIAYASSIQSSNAINSVAVSSWTDIDSIVTDAKFSSMPRKDSLILSSQFPLHSSLHGTFTPTGITSISSNVESFVLSTINTASMAIQTSNLKSTAASWSVVGLTDTHTASAHSTFASLIQLPENTNSVSVSTLSHANSPKIIAKFSSTPSQNENVPAFSQSKKSLDSSGTASASGTTSRASNVESYMPLTINTASMVIQTSNLKSTAVSRSVVGPTDTHKASARNAFASLIQLPENTNSVAVSTLSNENSIEIGAKFSSTPSKKENDSAFSRLTNSLESSGTASALGMTSRASKTDVQNTQTAGSLPDIKDAPSPDTVSTTFDIPSIATIEALNSTAAFSAENTNSIKLPNKATMVEYSITKSLSSHMTSSASSGTFEATAALRSGALIKSSSPDITVLHANLTASAQKQRYSVESDKFMSYQNINVTSIAGSSNTVLRHSVEINVLSANSFTKMEANSNLASSLPSKESSESSQPILAVTTTIQKAIGKSRNIEGTVIPSLSPTALSAAFGFSDTSIARENISTSNQLATNQPTQDVTVETSTSKTADLMKNSRSSNINSTGTIDESSATSKKPAPTEEMSSASLQSTVPNNVFSAAAVASTSSFSEFSSSKSRLKINSSSTVGDTVSRDIKPNFATVRKTSVNTVLASIKPSFASINELSDQLFVTSTESLGNSAQLISASNKTTKLTKILISANIATKNPVEAAKLTTNVSFKSDGHITEQSRDITKTRPITFSNEIQASSTATPQLEPMTQRAYMTKPASLIKDLSSLTTMLTDSRSSLAAIITPLQTIRKNSKALAEMTLSATTLPATVFDSSLSAENVHVLASAKLSKVTASLHSFGSNEPFKASVKIDMATIKRVLEPTSGIDTMNTTVASTVSRYVPSSSFRQGFGTTVDTAVNSLIASRPESHYVQSIGIESVVSFTIRAENSIEISSDLPTAVGSIGSSRLSKIDFIESITSLQRKDTASSIINPASTPTLQSSGITTEAPTTDFLNADKVLTAVKSALTATQRRSHVVVSQSSHTTSTQQPSSSTKMLASAGRSFAGTISIGSYINGVIVDAPSAHYSAISTFTSTTVAVTIESDGFVTRATTKLPLTKSTSGLTAVSSINASYLPENVTSLEIAKSTRRSILGASTNPSEHITTSVIHSYTILEESSRVFSSININLAGQATSIEVPSKPVEISSSKILDSINARSFVASSSSTKVGTISKTIATPSSETLHLDMSDSTSSSSHLKSDKMAATTMNMLALKTVDLISTIENSNSAPKKQPSLVASSSIANTGNISTTTVALFSAANHMDTPFSASDILHVSASSNFESEGGAEPTIEILSSKRGDSVNTIETSDSASEKHPSLVAPSSSVTIGIMSTKTAALFSEANHVDDSFSASNSVHVSTSSNFKSEREAEPTIEISSSKRGHSVNTIETSNSGAIKLMEIISSSSLTIDIISTPAVAPSSDAMYLDVHFSTSATERVFPSPYFKSEKGAATNVEISVSKRVDSASSTASSLATIESITIETEGKQNTAEATYSEMLDSVSDMIATHASSSQRTALLSVSIEDPTPIFYHTHQAPAGSTPKLDVLPNMSVTSISEIASTSSEVVASSMPLVNSLSAFPVPYTKAESILSPTTSSVLLPDELEATRTIAVSDATLPASPITFRVVSKWIAVSSSEPVTSTNIALATPIPVQSISKLVTKATETTGNLYSESVTVSNANTVSKISTLSTIQTLRNAAKHEPCSSTSHSHSSEIRESRNLLPLSYVIRPGDSLLTIGSSSSNRHSTGEIATPKELSIVPSQSTLTANIKITKVPHSVIDHALSSNAKTTALSSIETENVAESEVIPFSETVDSNPFMPNPNSFPGNSIKTLNSERVTASFSSMSPFDSVGSVASSDDTLQSSRKGPENVTSSSEAVISSNFTMASFSSPRSFTTATESIKTSVKTSLSANIYQTVPNEVKSEDVARTTRNLPSASRSTIFSSLENSKLTENSYVDTRVTMTGKIDTEGTTKAFPISSKDITTSDSSTIAENTNLGNSKLQNESTSKSVTDLS